MNVLFVCSRNKWRSLTAETIYKNNPSHTVKSAGTSSVARIVVSEKLLKWADIVFIKEKKHRLLLEQNFNEVTKAKEIITLEIEDNYKYMDSELIEVIKDSVDFYLKD